MSHPINRESYKPVAVIRSLATSATSIKKNANAATKHPIAVFIPNPHHSLRRSQTKTQLACLPAAVDALANTKPRTDAH